MEPASRILRHRPSGHARLGDRQDELAASGAVLHLLAQDLVGEVPGETRSRAGAVRRRRGEITEIGPFRVG